MKLGTELRECPRCRRNHAFPVFVQHENGYIVYCNFCGTHTVPCEEEEEAIRLWNEAERTAPEEPQESVPTSRHC